jgi:hypothetical protein
MKHSSSFRALSIAKLVGNIRQHATQNLIAAPSLKRFKHKTRRSRFAPRTSIGNILLGKMIPDAFPLLVP